MPRKPIDHTGDRFGRLVVVTEGPRTKPTRSDTRGRIQWACLCDCGAEVLVDGASLRRTGGTRSCGCLAREKASATCVMRNWTGDAATYSAVHQRIRSSRGAASDHPCEDCGSPAEDWSYRGGCPDERIEPRKGLLMPFSLNPTLYDPRCKTCHRNFDRPSPCNSHRDT